MENQKNATSGRGVGLISKKIFYFESGAKVVVIDYAIANLRPFFFLHPKIHRVWVEDALGNEIQSTRFRPRSSPKPVEVPQVLGLLFRKGQSQVTFCIAPVSVFGTTLNALIWLLDRVSMGSRSLHVMLSSLLIGNMVSAGGRDRATGAIIAPIIKLPAKEGEYTINAKVGAAKLSLRFKVAPYGPQNVEEEYFKGDGHVHTDYSWFSPTLHFPNGPSVAARTWQAHIKGLRWVFLTDYSIQFFSKKAFGGINHTSNGAGSYVDAHSGNSKDRRFAVWNDRNLEIKNAKREIWRELGQDMLVLRAVEVSSEKDSHTLVWAQRPYDGESWSQPDRVRSEQIDGLLCSLFQSVLAFFRINLGCGARSFGHDEPWAHESERLTMCEYEGYTCHPLAYRESDLTYARKFTYEPLLVAAHPMIAPYQFAGFKLMRTASGFWPQATSHASGSALCGFEIFEEPQALEGDSKLRRELAKIQPARLAKPEVLAIWNMFLWRELRKSFETGFFLAAFANSDAHLYSISGQNKFGLTATFVRVPKEERLKHDENGELTFQPLVWSLKKGRCVCTSLGDFATLVLFEVYHPGDFVEVKQGEGLKFKVFQKPASPGSKFKGFHLFTCMRPPRLYTKDKEKYMEWAAYELEKSGKWFDEAEASIDEKDPFYPGNQDGRWMSEGGCAQTCFRAEVVFEDELGQSKVYTNPIFVRLTKGLDAPHKLLNPNMRIP